MRLICRERFVYVALIIYIPDPGGHRPVSRPPHG